MAGLRTILLVLAVLVSSGLGHAATIALVKPASSSPELREALFRLEGELLAVGLQVEVAASAPAAGSELSDDGDSQAWLQTVVGNRAIDAVIRVVGDKRPVAVDVWIVEHATHTFRSSRVLLDERARDASATLAIRAIEVLRANFLVVDGAGREPRRAAVPESAPLPHGPSREPLEGFGLEAGVSLLTSLDGVGPAFLPLVRVDWRLHAPLVAQLTLAGLGNRATVETRAGGVGVAQQHALLGLCHCASSESLIRPIFSLAAGVSRTSLTGWAESPNQGHRLQRWAFVVDGSVGGRLRISPRYHLGLAAGVQFAQPSVVIHFVDERVAAVGRPNVLLSLTVGASL